MSSLADDLLADLDGLSDEGEPMEEDANVVAGVKRKAAEDQEGSEQEDGGDDGSIDVRFCVLLQVPCC